MKRITRKLANYHDISQWSAFWDEELEANREISIRANDPEYNIYRFCNNPYSWAYKFLDTKRRAIAFSGVNVSHVRKWNDAFKIAALTDFIVEPSCRGNGVVREIIHDLLAHELNAYDEILIFPYNRNAYITWRMTLPIKNVYELNIWKIGICNNRFTQVNEHIEITRVNEIEENLKKFLNGYPVNAIVPNPKPGYLKWRYLNYPQKYQFFLIYFYGNLAGFFTFREVCGDECISVEIGDLYIDPLIPAVDFKIILGSVFSFLNVSGHRFVYLKVINGNVFDKYICNHADFQRTRKRKYIFSVENEKDCILTPSIDWMMAGENYDFPRSIVR